MTFPDDCDMSRFYSNLQTPPANLLVLDEYNIDENNTDTESLLGYVVTSEEPCLTYGYEPCFIECVSGMYQ